MSMEAARLEFLCTSDVAKIAHVTTDTVRLWNRIGRLPAIRTAGGVRLFRPDDVNRIITERAAAKDAATSV
jgi:DNA-binding transcriptional MerR regulator